LTKVTKLDQHFFYDPDDLHFKQNEY